MRKLKDFSYPPTDAECESWMNWLRKLHKGREAQRQKESKELWTKIARGEVDEGDEDTGNDMLRSRNFSMMFKGLGIYRDFNTQIQN